MSERRHDLDDAPRPVDPVFRDAVRAELLATVAATRPLRRGRPSPARRRTWRQPAGLSALVLAGVVGGGAVAVASGLVTLPGADRVQPRSAELDLQRTGTATVDLGAPPEGATHVELAFTCLDAGTFDLGDGGASVSCSAAEAPATAEERGDGPAPGTVSWSQPLEEVTTGVTISTTPGTRWAMTRTFSTHTPTEWGVNAKGETYGVQKPDGSTPDLIAVHATNGETGYAYATELNYAPDFSSPEEALAWQESGSPTPIVTVYESDGTTVVGTFDNGSDD
ncbi:hypothetical protein WDZ17_16895 [Pseudokineococcus basanitobsidens]|uniref:Uncharacterized protein n=1 Tax=Pseudokineococcus basanitobsidens TaxID=1926649 RepID=A0ABU8RPI6_9ACTN